MARRWAAVGVLLLAAGLLLAAAQEGEHVSTDGTSDKPQEAPIYGDRKPWADGRQDAYDRDIREEHWFTKIWQAFNDSRPAPAEEAFAKPLCDTLEAVAETAHGGQWHADAVGHVWWEPAGCRLRRLTGPEARQCLAFRHLFFAGDSITRYQYLSLVSFLSKGANQLAWGHGAAEKSLGIEWEWDGWDNFFKLGSELLASHAVGATAHEDCDCSHSSSKDGNTSYDYRTSHEHRSFTLKDFTTVGGNQTGNFLRVTHRQVYHLPTHIQAGVDVLDFGLQTLPQQSSLPDAVVLNMGLAVWDLEATEHDYRRRFDAVLRHGAALNARLPGDRRARLLWKSTTATAEAPDSERVWAAVNQASQHAAAAASPAWQLLDVRRAFFSSTGKRELTVQALRQRLFLYSFDKIHFAPQVYQEFNDLLLNMLCSPALEFQTAAPQEQNAR